MFQSTHPRGVRLPCGRCRICRNKFQSTHPRGVRRITVEEAAPITLVSIHAPTWGATSTWRFSGKGKHVSIHAPTWGATSLWHTKNLYLMFQSTHPRGVRLTCLGRDSSRRSFNPRTHVGCDFRFRVDFAKSICFNPRTHVGCDLILTISVLMV